MFAGRLGRRGSERRVARRAIAGRHRRGDRTSPRSCRVHSRGRDVGSRGRGARPPCSTAVTPLRAVHRASCARGSKARCPSRVAPSLTRTCREHSREAHRDGSRASGGGRAPALHPGGEPGSQRSIRRAGRCPRRFVVVGAEVRAKGPAGPRGEARGAESVVRACDAAEIEARVASAVGATEQTPLPVSRERTPRWS